MTLSSGIVSLIVRTVVSGLRLDIVLCKPGVWIPMQMVAGEDISSKTNNWSIKETNKGLHSSIFAFKVIAFSSDTSLMKVKYGDEKQKIMLRHYSSVNIVY